MAENKIVDVQVGALIYGGEAMARLADGRAVFVRGALPGETVRIRLVEEKPRFARGRLEEVLVASPDRVTLTPEREQECAGCHYHHLRYEAQLAAKTEIVRDQLKRLASIAQPPVNAIIPSPKEWHYRNTAQFHLDERGQLGFQEEGSHYVTPLRQSALCEEAINDLLPQLDFGDSLTGVERIALRAGAGDDMMVILESNDPQPPDLTVDLPISVVHLFTDEGGGAHSVVMAGDDHVVMEAMGRAFQVSAGSFFQVNTQQAENMVRYLLDVLPLDANKTLLEVYAGVGLFSAFFAPKVGKLAAVELSESAVNDFAVNLDAFDNVELYAGLAEEVLPALEIEAHICVVDPPRAGLAAPVLDTLLRLGPGVIAYVSCDPATLARDAKRLVAGGYQLKSVQPFDMFPQTYHIESISLFKKG